MHIQHGKFTPENINKTYVDVANELKTRGVIENFSVKGSNVELTYKGMNEVIILNPILDDILQKNRLNENNIKRYKENGIPLEEYGDRINSYEDALSNIKAMKEYAKNEMENNENSSSDAGFLEVIINYNSSIEYIVKKIRFFNIEEVYMLVNEIEAEFKQERELLGDLLGKIIISAKRTANGENLKKMINMKNSLRSNVNVRSILFNFFDTLQEIV